jgi:hypothetical protein
MSISDVHVRDDIRHNRREGFVNTVVIEFLVEGEGPFSVELDRVGFTKQKGEKAIRERADQIVALRSMK